VFSNFTVVIVDSYGKLLSEDVSFADFFLEGAAGLHFRTFLISCSCTLVGPPGWGLGVRLTTPPHKKILLRNLERRQRPTQGCRADDDDDDDDDDNTHTGLSPCLQSSIIATPYSPTRSHLAAEESLYSHFNTNIMHKAVTDEYIHSKKFFTRKHVL
jgi:hypothetical protein